MVYFVRPHFNAFRFEEDDGTDQTKILFHQKIVRGGYDENFYQLQNLQLARNGILPMCGYVATLFSDKNEGTRPVG